MKLTLVDSNLTNCIEDSIISTQKSLDLHSLIQPASIDLPASNNAYLLSKRALTPEHSIEEILPEITLQTFNLNDETLLLKHHTYLIETDIEINLPKHISAKCSSKSSIGRIDVLVRCVCSKTKIYDTFFPQSRGKLYLEVTPQSFNIIIKKGVALSQIRLFEEVHNTSDILDEQGEQQLLQSCITNKENEDIVCDENIAFLNVEITKDCFGYVAKNTQKPINLTKINEHNPTDYFDKITAQEDSSKKINFVIEKDKFYIFHTCEKICVPPTHSVEMLPYSHLIGDFRAHYAGFFDPGFGNATGLTGVLEVRSYEDITMYSTQPICAIKIYKNKESPKNLYGECNNNYQNQNGPKLAKFFK